VLELAHLVAREADAIEHHVAAAAAMRPEMVCASTRGCSWISLP